MTVGYAPFGGEEILLGAGLARNIMLPAYVGIVGSGRGEAGLAMFSSLGGCR